MLHVCNLCSVYQTHGWNPSLSFLTSFLPTSLLPLLTFFLPTSISSLLSHLLQEPESLASSVVDGIQQLLMNLRLSDVMISRPVPPGETGGRGETNNIGVSKILVGDVCTWYGKFCMLQNFSKIKYVKYVMFSLWNAYYMLLHNTTQHM